MIGLEQQITALAEQGADAPKDQAREIFARLRAELAAGRVRAAEPDPSSPGGWRVNEWVKQGILVGFRCGDVVDMGIGKGRWPFFDKDTLPLKTCPQWTSCASRRVVRRSATAPISERASSAWRRCTSTSAPTWATAH
jgi:hypothetical protein